MSGMTFNDQFGIFPIMLEFAKILPQVPRSNIRLKINQRFIFLAMKSLMKASYSGIIINCFTLFPMIGVCVTDQPQERVFMCLKGADSFADCIECIMGFKYNEDRNEANCEQKSIGIIISGINSDGDKSLTYDPSEICASDQPDSDAIVVERNIGLTVIFMLPVARATREKNNSSDPTWKSRLRSWNEYLERTSANAFPPALACFDGMVSRTHHLYRSIGLQVDKLHTFDHRPSRVLFNIFPS